MEALRNYLKEVRKIPLLTAQEEKELSRRARKGDQKARMQMIRSNLRLVINIAKKYAYLGIPFLDLVEEGNLGLMKAVDKFNYNKGFRFSTYAAWWIRQSITRSISEQAKMIRVPVYMNELIAKWKKTKESMSQESKSTPLDRDVARKMRISKEKMQQISFWQSSTTSSLDASIGDDDEAAVMDLIEDVNTILPDAGIEQLMYKERVKSLLETMNLRERHVLDMRFGLESGSPQTLAEVAKKMGVSRERVRQIERDALRKLRQFIRKQEKNYESAETR